MARYDHESLLQTGPTSGRVLQSIPYQRLRRVWYERQMLFRILDPYLRVAATGATDQGDGSFPATDPHLRCLQPAAGRQTGDYEEREACCRMIANLFSGKMSMLSNTQVLQTGPHLHPRRVRHARQTLVRMKLLSGVHFRSRTCVSQSQDGPSREPKVSRRTGPHLEYRQPTARQRRRPTATKNERHAATNRECIVSRQTDDDEERKTCSRILANLLFGRKSMPSNSRVIQSRP